MANDAPTSPGRERLVSRLRFADPAQEDRFQVERQSSALKRARLMAVVASAVVAFLGLLEVIYTMKGAPDYVSISLTVRLLMVVPLWVAMLASTYLPGHTRRADWVYASVTVGVAWALAFLKWHLPIYFSGANLFVNPALDLTIVMLVSFFTLPIRFRWLVGAVVLIVGGVGAGYLATTSGALFRDAKMLTLFLSAISVLLLVSLRSKELAERELFAQREQLEALNAELARLNAEKQEFMAIAAHDLRAPLAAVGGLVEALQAGVIRGVEQVGSAHGAARDMIRHMLGLVDDYLGAHAAEHAELPVRLGAIEASEALAATAGRFAAQAAGKGQAITVEAAAVALRVQGDPALLGQILDNLVSNALKFSPAGAEVELYLLQAEQGGRVRLVVADRGPGVPVGEQGGLFRMFGRTTVKPTAGEKSHGIGLAVTKRLATAMGGSVGCESPRTDGKAGAEFWVELPAGAEEGVKNGGDR